VGDGNGDRVELWTSIRILDSVREEVDYIIELNLDHNLSNLYRIEEDIPRELLNFVERLRALPYIELRELEE